MATSKITVVIPNWNGRKLIGACLDSLRKQTLEHDVIVVDNGSNDDSVGFIRDQHPEVRLTQLKRNQGFAGGVNVGIRQAQAAGAEFIALLNNDAVAKPDWLAQLKAGFSEPTIGIVTAKLVRSGSHKLDSTGELYSIWGTPFPRGRDEQDNGQYDDAAQREVFAASGGATMYRTAVFNQIGLFDEAFFAYYEDVDLSFRAHLVGWQIRYQPSAQAHHQVGATSTRLGNFRHYHMLKNYPYLYIKNMPGLLFWKYLPTYLVGLVGRIVSLLRQRKFGVVLKAAGSVIIRMPMLLIERLQIQHHRTVTSQAIDKLLTHQPAPSQLARWPFRWFYPQR